MPTTISSRTPGGSPNHCPLCDAAILVEPSEPPGDAPCPNCGTLLWFSKTPEGLLFYDAEAVKPIRAKIMEILSAKLGWNMEQVEGTTLFREEIGADSLGPS